MTHREMLWLSSFVLGAACLGPAAARAQSAAPSAASSLPPMVLSSPAFKDGEMMPVSYGDIRLTNNVNQCGADAKKVSPALSWVNVPARTTTFVISMLDVDAGLGAAHFVAYDIPREKSGLAENELNDPKGFVAGKNYRTENYSGPCPPAGPAHHYVITLIATDLPVGALKAGMTRDEVLAAVVGHNVGVSSLIGKYGR